MDATSGRPGIGRRVSVAIIAVGLLAAGIARVVNPGAPPLYDGVLPLVPYVYLDPPAGAPGGATGATISVGVTAAKNELVALGTNELQPQAQLLAAPGSLIVSPGATRLDVSVEPVNPAGAPSEGQISGNVYRFIVTDDAGATVTALATASVSVVLRSADPSLTSATIARYVNGAWEPLDTALTSSSGSFIAVVSSFGDFAVIAPTVDAGQPRGVGVATLPWWLIAALVGIVVAIAVIALVVPRRRRGSGAVRAAPPSTGTPQGPRPRESGRSARGRKPPRRRR